MIDTELRARRAAELAERIADDERHSEHNRRATLFPKLVAACKALRAHVMYRDDPRLCDWVDAIIVKAKGETS